jgi:hypothetical protein
MAEKTGDMKQFDAVEPVSAMTGRGLGGDEGEQDVFPASDLERKRMNANLGEHPPETEHIKSQIEATRHQMGETIDAIQEKLSMENISNEISTRVTDAIESAKNTAYEATIGKAAEFMKITGDQISNSKAVEVARNNPIPLILLGVGAGWLAYSGFSSRGAKGRRTRERQYQLQSGGGETGERSRVADTYREGLAKASEAASTAYDGVSEAVSGAYSRATGLANKTYETAGEYAHAAQEQYEQYIESNPLAVGALAFAAGAAVGFAFPSTKFEGEIMGATRDKVLTKAQTAAGDLIDRTKQIAEENRTLKQSDNIVH